MATSNLASVVVAVDSSEESMNALRWALDNLRLRPDGALVALHVQPSPSIVAGLKPSIQAPSPSAARATWRCRRSRKRSRRTSGGSCRRSWSTRSRFAPRRMWR